MPNYQNKEVLKELIRGFVRIPEEKKYEYWYWINKF